MIGKYRVLNLFSDFAVIPPIDYDEDTETPLYEPKANLPKISIDTTISNPKAIDPKAYGKLPVIEVVDKNGNVIAVIDYEYRIWLHKDTFSKLSEGDIADIVINFWRLMSDENFVKNFIKLKASLVGVQLRGRSVTTTVNKIVESFSSTLPEVEEVLNEFKEITKAFEKFIEDDELIIPTSSDQSSEEENAITNDEEDNGEQITDALFNDNGGRDTGSGRPITLDDLLG